MVGEVTVQGVMELERLFRDAGNIAAQVAERGLRRCALLAQAEAVENAPRSPTKEQFSATLKRKKRTDRKDFFPGGLEKSIDIDYDRANMAAVVCVRENSYAAKYARKIHDEKGSTWHNRGPGTIAKGDRADEKFIERAIRENEARFLEILTDEFRKAIGGMNK